MEYAYTRHRGPPPASERRAGGPAAGREHDRERERAPLHARRPSFDEDRFASRRLLGSHGGPPVNSDGAAGFDERDDRARARAERLSERERPRRWADRERERPAGRSYAPPGSPNGERGGAGAAGPSGPPFRRGPPARRPRSLSPPPQHHNDFFKGGPAPPSRPRFDQQSLPADSPKRPWGRVQQSAAATQEWSRDDRRDSTVSSQRFDGPAFSQNNERPPFPASAGKFQRNRRGRGDDHFDRRPLDNGWSRQARSNGDLNAPAWQREDKGKGPALDYDDRRSLPPHNQNRPPAPSSNGSIARSPENVRPVLPRSPSFDGHIARSPASSTHSQARPLPPVEYEREYSRPSQQRAPNSTFGPQTLQTRAHSASQPSPRRSLEFPPDRHPPEASVESRTTRSASVSQSPRQPVNRVAWPARRRSRSASPPRRSLDQPTEASPSRSLVDRLGPLASSTSASDPQTRAEPVVFPGRTPPSAKVPSKPSQTPPTLHSSPNSPSRPVPTSPSSQREVQALQHLPSPPKDASPSPKLASSPSEGHHSPTLPSQRTLDHADVDNSLRFNLPADSVDDVKERIVATQAAFADGLPPSPASLEKALPVTEKVELQESQDPTMDTLQGTRSGGIEETVMTDIEMHESATDIPTAELNEADQSADNSRVIEMDLDEEATLEGVVPDAPETLAASTADHVTDATSLDTSKDVSLMDVDSTRPSSPSSEHDAAAKDIASDSKEEDLETKEFEMSLQSFIETSRQDEGAQQDLSAIWLANRLKAPVTLPLAVEMPEEGRNPFEVAPVALANHDLLDALLQEDMRKRDERWGIKIVRLRQQYKELDSEWQAHCSKFEKIKERQERRKNMPHAPPAPAYDAGGAAFTPATPSLLAPSGRSNRRSATSSLGYGDAARSEAEFLEILASLEDADMRDPNLRAMRTTATVPDQILNPSELTLQYYKNDNGLVTDPVEHYGINKTPDNWTEDEIAIFCRRYALYPKQFGKIAAALPDKTTPQCVLFYYRSKKKIDFRALVDRRNRDGRRKRIKGDKQADPAGTAANAKKGPSLLGNLHRSRGDEPDDDDEEDEPQTPGTALAQETAVLSTARALTQQLNGIVSDGLSRADANHAAPPTISRMNSSKKAARFLSPPAQSHLEEGVAPPSDGALAAAEALGFLSNVPHSDIGITSARPSSAKQRKRKPSMVDAMPDTPGTEDGRPISAGASSKRTRPHSSSYWSVADKNEFMRLLSLHGKNYAAIAEGIESKTAVQCKNFFQNNTKKMGLAEIAARAEGEAGDSSLDAFIADNETGAGAEVPSVFGDPSDATGKPPSGYFLPSTSNGHREPVAAHTAPRSGGMHLHNLLDDAPDAEGGAHPAPQRQSGSIRPPIDDDSATEDEEEPARYARDGPMPRYASKHAQTRSHVDHLAYPGHALRPHIEESMAIDPALQEGGPAYPAQAMPHARSSSYGRPEYVVREHYSPPYPNMVHDERGHPMHTRAQHVNGHYDPASPYHTHWTPYDNRPVFIDRRSASGSGQFPHTQYEEVHAGTYYGRDQFPYAESPIVDKPLHHSYPGRPQHSPYHEAHRASPRLPPAALRQRSEGRILENGSPYYEHHHQHLPRSR